MTQLSPLKLKYNPQLLINLLFIMRMRDPRHCKECGTEDNLTFDKNEEDIRVDCYESSVLPQLDAIDAARMLADRDWETKG
jgi:hypothetical protein